LTDWEAKIREHGPMAFQAAWRILGHLQDTEDAVQEAFLEAFRPYGRSEVRNWAGFLRTAAACRALDRLRQRRPAGPLPPELTSPAGERPDQLAQAKELADWLRNSIALLPERQAEVISLRYFGELSNAEIASALDITHEAVAVALHKARASIASMRNRTEREARSSSS
jgi:RNA polymerase sigma-70 factor (ECF subfamily)